MKQGILAGVRIVEIGGIGPGPFCGMHLADLGADVIVVERGAPSSSRNVTNRGKRSVCADLKTDEGRNLVLGLVADADALIEGMRPGVMERLGLGPGDCATHNPRLVYGRITGWGQTGPLAPVAGHDNNFAALSGALFHAGTPNEPPVAPVSLLGDVAGGALYLALGVLAGVLNARSTGKGTVVDAAMVDGCAHMLQLLLSSQATGATGYERGASMHDGSHFFATYQCADAEYITVAALEPQFYALLLEKLELTNDPRYAKQWNRNLWPELKADLAQRFLQRTRAEWTALLEGSDVCFAPVLRPAEAAQHPHLQARSTFYEAHGIMQPTVAPRFNGQVVQPQHIPARGADTAAITEAIASGTPQAAWLAPSSSQA